MSQKLGHETAVDDKTNLHPPPALERIEVETKKLGFEMASDHQTGCLLRTLASTKPSAKILELGTGTGLSAAWMLDGMDASSRLLSVDNNKDAVSIAEETLGHDARVEFHVQDGLEFLKNLSSSKFDMIFADTWPGKIRDMELALNLLAEGGIYVVDDMSHQPRWDSLNWDHIGDIRRVIQELESKDDFIRTKLCWSTGIIIVTKRPGKSVETAPTGASHH